jgi:hypothetical protein
VNLHNLNPATRRAPGGLVGALAEFLHAAVRPRSPLAKAIVAILWFKFLVVVSLSLYLHAEGPRPVTASQTLDRLLNPPPR